MMIEIRGHSSYVNANGLRHHLLRYGDPEAADLLMLPGITSPAATADFLAVHLAYAGFHVTVPDIRGRGQTDRAPRGHYQLTDYAADIAALVDALPLQQPVVIGHSMGARIAAAYCALYDSHDHAPLVLVDPPVSGPGRAPYPTTRDSFDKQLNQAYRGTNADEVRHFYPEWPLRELQLRAELLASCDRDAVMETYDRFHTEDFINYWRQLTPPLALICGGDSPVVPPETIAELQVLQPDATVRTVPNAGHMVPWDNLPGFLEVALPYLHQACQAEPSTHRTGNTS